MKSVSVSMGSDHRGMKLKDDLSKWLIPVDSDIGTRFNIDLFHDIGTYDTKKKFFNTYSNIIFCFVHIHTLYRVK